MYSEIQQKKMPFTVSRIKFMSFFAFSILQLEITLTNRGGYRGGKTFAPLKFQNSFLIALKGNKT